MFRTADLLEAKLLLAGEYRDAKSLCSKFCENKGFCVSLRKIDIVWTGGEAPGVEVYCFNFPRANYNVKAWSLELLVYLMRGMAQDSGTVIIGDQVITLYGPDLNIQELL